MAVDIFCVIQALHVDTGTHLITLLQVDHVLDSAAFGLLVTLRQVVNLLPVQTTHLREEHHRRVHRSLINPLDEVLITCATGFRTDTATALLTEVSQRSTFDIAQMRNSDHHLVVGVHIFRIELGSHLHNLRAALIAVFVLDLDKLGIDDVVTHLLAGQQLVQMRNQFLDLLIFRLQLIDTQTSESRQTHIYDSFRLQIVQIETLLQVSLSICRSAACTDDTNHLVDIIYGDDQALQDVRFLLSLTQLIARTTGNDIHSVVNEVAD